MKSKLDKHTNLVGQRGLNLVNNRVVEAHRLVAVWALLGQSTNVALLLLFFDGAPVSVSALDIVEQGQA